MKATTKKISEGEYAVLVDGRPTSLRIVRGAAPKYRCRQEWMIAKGQDDWLTYDQPGKSAALATIQSILDAAQAV